MEKPTEQKTAATGSTEKIIRTLTWIIIAITWAWTIFKFSSLPERIPIHFNGAGVADGWGHKATIFFLPLVSTVLIGWIGGINFGIRKFNLPVNGDPVIMSKMICALSLSLAIIFFTITFKTIEVAADPSKTLGSWMLPFIIAVIAAPTIYFMVLQAKLKSGKNGK